MSAAPILKMNFTCTFMCFNSYLPQMSPLSSINTNKLHTNSNYLRTLSLIMSGIKLAMWIKTQLRALQLELSNKQQLRLHMLCKACQP